MVVVPISKALTMANENHNTEITNNQEDLIDISEQNIKNNVNNITEKYQDLSHVPVKPSDPSDPSANNENKGIDKKQDSQIVNEIHGTAISKPANSSCSIKPFPQFECPFEGCGQSFPNQSDLISHMDKESEDARKKVGK